MHVNVILFGLSRNKTCLNSIACLIRNLKRRVSVRVFAALYDRKNLNLKRSNEKCDLRFPHEWCSDHCDMVSILDHESVWSELQAPFFKLQEYGDAWNNNFESLKNLLLQLHSMKVAYDMIDTPSDVTVSMRIDLHYIDHLSDIDLAFTEPCIKIPVPYLPFCTTMCELFYGLNDRLLVCNHVNFCDIVLRRLDYAKLYCEKTNRPLHAEQFLKWLCEQYAIPKKILHMKASRIRCDGRVAKLDHTMYMNETRLSILVMGLVVVCVLLHFKYSAKNIRSMRG